MTERTLKRSTAICAVTLIAAAILILLIFPVRVFKETYATDGGMESAGAQAGVTGPVTREDTLVQRFTAQYDRLQAVEVWIEEVTLGRSIELDVFDPQMRMMVKRYYDLKGETIPGMVTLPLGLDLEVGEEYVLLFQGLFSTVRFGLVPEADASDYLGMASYRDTGIEHEKLAVSIAYELPLSKGVSLALIAAVAAVALFACALVRRHYQLPVLPFMKGTPREVTTLILDPPLTIRHTLQVVLNPVLCAFFGILFVLNWPLKKFDDRPLDLVVYGLGILIAWGVSLYLVNRDESAGTGTMTHFSLRKEQPEQAGEKRVIVPVPHDSSLIPTLLQMASIAAILWYSTDYMNGLYDINHRISERQITIAFLLFLLFTFSWKELTGRLSILICAALAAASAAYVYMNRIPLSERDADIGNQVVRLTGVCVLLTGIVLYHVIRSLITKREELRIRRLTLFGVTGILFAILFIVFRNGWLWGVALICYYGLFYLRFQTWEGRKRWNAILLGGLALNFLVTAGYCLLYRYYAAFITSRFAMRFHTVTVTAEYLTIMCGAAIVLFLGQRRKVYNTMSGFVLTGIVAAYTIFTLSRTAYLAVLATGVVLLAIDTISGQGGRGKNALKTVGAILGAVLLLFPAVFTLQRILPVMVGHPVMYEIEGVDERIRGSVAWDHKNLMCAERFIGHFRSKILGMEEPGYNYPVDDYNYDENGERLYDLYGNPLAATDSGPRRARAEEVQEQTDDSAENFSNGRLTIFKAYWEGRNLTGHREMGALFPDGTVIMHAHNVYLQVMYDNGMITGAVFVLWLVAGVYTAVRRFWRSLETDPYALLPVAVFVGFMVAGLTEWNFQYANPMTIALMLSAASLICRDLPLKQETE